MASRLPVQGGPHTDSPASDVTSAVQAVGDSRYVQQSNASTVTAASGSPAKGNVAHADGAGGWNWRREQINVLDYGAVPDNATDLAPAFDAACAAAVYNLAGIIGGVGGAFATNGLAATVYIPAGVYYSSRTLIPPTGVRVTGEHGAGWTAGTIIRFPAGVPGMMLPFTTKDGTAGNAYSSWALVEHLSLVASGSRLPASNFDGTSHGLTLRGTGQEARSVYCAGFKGHGFAIIGDATLVSTDPTFGSPNITRGWNCYADGNAGHGFYAIGHDANAGVWIGCSAIDNGSWGFYDDSALGNVWIGCHASGNAGTVVTNIYTSGPNTDIAATGNGGYCFAPRLAGANSSTAQGFGNYTEGGAETFLGQYAVAYGGAGAPSYTGPGSYIGPSGGGEVLKALAMPAAVFDFDNGAGLHGYLGLNPSPATGRALQAFLTGILDLELIARSDGWGLNNGASPNPFMVFLAAGARFGGGATVQFENALTLGPDAIELGYSTGAPVSGTHQKGDIALERSPVPTGYIGYVCTTGGTPGTWKGFGAIAA